MVAKWEHARGVHANSKHLLLLLETEAHLKPSCRAHGQSSAAVRTSMGGAGGAPKMRRADAIDVDDSMDAHDDVGSEDEWEPVCEVTEDGTVVNHVPWEGQHAGS